MKKEIEGNKFKCALCGTIVEYPAYPGFSNGQIMGVCNICNLKQRGMIE